MEIAPDEEPALPVAEEEAAPVPSPKNSGARTPSSVRESKKKEQEEELTLKKDCL